MEEIGRTNIFLLMLSVLRDLPQEQKSSSDTPVGGSISWLFHLVFLTLGHCHKIVQCHADPDVNGDRLSFCCAPILPPEKWYQMPFGGDVWMMPRWYSRMLPDRRGPGRTYSFVKEILGFTKSNKTATITKPHTPRTIPLLI